MAKKRFRQAEVWRFLKKNPGKSVSEIAEGVGMEVYALSRILSRMRVRGSIRCHGRTFGARWYVSPKGLIPHDGRGTAAGSLEALKPKQEDWKTGMRAAALARGLDPDTFMKRERVVKAKPAIALEKFWGFPNTPVLRVGDGDD